MGLCCVFLLEFEQIIAVIWGVLQVFFTRVTFFLKECVVKVRFLTCKIYVSILFHGYLILRLFFPKINKFRVIPIKKSLGTKPLLDSNLFFLEDRITFKNTF